MLSYFNSDDRDGIRICLGIILIPEKDFLKRIPYAHGLSLARETLNVMPSAEFGTTHRGGIANLAFENAGYQIINFGLLHPISLNCKPFSVPKIVLILPINCYIKDLKKVRNSHEVKHRF